MASKQISFKIKRPSPLATAVRVLAKIEGRTLNGAAIYLAELGRRDWERVHGKPLM
jgi:hypothetical protein